MDGFMLALNSVIMSAQDYGLPLPFTGDSSKPGLMLIVMGIALIVIVVMIVSMRRGK